MTSEPPVAGDRIGLTGLRVHGRHGVYDREREAGQDFVVDVELRLDARAAAASDELADTVDYGALAEALYRVVAGPPVRLLETLANRLADVCLTDERVQSVRVTVHKPQAPVSVPLADVSVSIERKRP